LAAKFNNPISLCVDSSGTYLYVSDSDNNAIRRINIATKAVDTFAGSASGTSGFANASGTSALFYAPRGIAIDSSDANLYVADEGNYIIRRIIIATQAVDTLAGTQGSYGYTDGTGTSAKFTQPFGLTIDPYGNLYVADPGSFTIRKIVIASGEVTRFAGISNSQGFADGNLSTAKFSYPNSIVFYSSNGTYYNFVSDHGIFNIRRITFY